LFTNITKDLVAGQSMQEEKPVEKSIQSKWGYGADTVAE
jgi:hypothetical protein